MPITVNRHNPPPYVVTTCQGPEETTQTLAFTTLEEAERAYRAAGQDKRFTIVLVGGKGQETVLTLVSLWRREEGQTVSGEPAVSYVDITPNGGLPDAFGLRELRCDGCGQPYGLQELCYRCRGQVPGMPLA